MAKNKGEPSLEKLMIIMEMNQNKKRNSVRLIVILLLALGAFLHI